MQGISFKEGEHSFKGSEIDRKFSYSKLDVVLSGNSHNKEQQVQQSAVPKDTGNTLLDNIASGVTESIFGIGGLFDVQPSNSDVEDLNQQALKKKKKPQKRRGIRR